MAHFWRKIQVYSLYIFGQKCKSIAFTFSSKNAKILAKKFFSQKNFFLCSKDSGPSKNAKKPKKNFSKIFTHFGQKCKSIAFTFSSKIPKLWPKNFFPKKNFFYVLWTQDIPKMKKNQKKNFQKFGPFLANFASL